MKKSLLLFFCLVFFVALHAQRSPVNQVFQFSQSASFTYPNATVGNATAYLWIPENCKKVRGLVMFCTNCPEHMLVGHSAIRKACADNNLGLVWFVPTFWNFTAGYETSNITFLQTVLDGLATKSGYSEVSTVPWLPMGESMH